MQCEPLRMYFMLIESLFPLQNDFHEKKHCFCCDKLYYHCEQTLNFGQSRAPSPTKIAAKPKLGKIAQIGHALQDLSEKRCVFEKKVGKVHLLIDRKVGQFSSW